MRSERKVEGEGEEGRLDSPEPRPSPDKTLTPSTACNARARPTETRPDWRPRKPCRAGEHKRQVAAVGEARRVLMGESAPSATDEEAQLVALREIVVDRHGHRPARVGAKKLLQEYADSLEAERRWREREERLRR